MKQAPSCVALVTATEFPSVNGVSRSVNTQRNALRKQGIQVYTLAPGHPGLRGIKKDPNVQRLPYLLNPIVPDYPILLPYGVNWLRLANVAPHLVHTQHPFSAGRLGEKIARRLSIPIVTTFHTEYLDYAEQYLWWMADSFRNKLVSEEVERHYNRCQAVICPSKAAESSLKRQYTITVPTHVIPTGVPLPEVTQESANRAAFCAKHEIPIEATILLTVGRLEKEKNIEFLLKAFVPIAKLVPHTYLVIAGDGSRKQAHERFVKERHIKDKVRFLGKVKPDQISTTYANADLLLYACTNDTQGLVVSEARAAGLPSLVTLGGGASESISPGVDGLVCTNNDVQFTKLLKDILSDPRTLRSWKSGCMETRWRFTPDLMGKKLYDLYSQVYTSSKRAG